MKLKNATYLAVRGVLEKWYGLGNDKANLQALLEVLELVEKDINEQLANQAKG